MLPGGLAFQKRCLIVEMDPQSGDPGGGDVVMIETTGFDGDFRVHLPDVFFGSNPARHVSALSASILEAVTPPSIVWGPVDVRVESTELPESATRRGGFTYLAPPPPPGWVGLFYRMFPLPSASVIYVIDRGSMMGNRMMSYVDRHGNVVSGTRWGCATEATIASIQRLDGSVSFNVYTHSCVLNSFAPVAVPATPANKAAAEAWIQGNRPYGGNGAGQAVAEALKEKSNLTLMLINTGTPSCDVSDVAWHKALILAENTQFAQVHTFGIETVGLVETFLMEVAAETGGTHTHVP